MIVFPPKTNNKKVQEKFPKRTEEKEESFSDQIEGRNSVLELLESGKDINKIFIEKGEKHGSINKIIGIAKDRKIVIVEVDRAIIRTAETAGVHGIIIPKRRACSVNSTVYKVASGAVEHVKIARVNNLNDEIKYLKSKDVWIYGTAIEATKYYYEENLKGAVALVIGNEGEGISRLVRENCDILLKIPMKGHITSLNASVSAGIVMYEVVKQRM